MPVVLLPQDAAEEAVPEAFDEAFDEHVPAADTTAAPAATARTGTTGVGSNMHTTTAKRGMRGGWQRCVALQPALAVAASAGLHAKQLHHCAAQFLCTWHCTTIAFMHASCYLLTGTHQRQFLTRRSLIACVQQSFHCLPNRWTHCRCTHSACH